AEQRRQDHPPASADHVRRAAAEDGHAHQEAGRGGEGGVPERPPGREQALRRRREGRRDDRGRAGEGQGARPDPPEIVRGQGRGCGRQEGQGRDGAVGWVEGAERPRPTTSRRGGPRSLRSLDPPYGPPKGWPVADFWTWVQTPEVLVLIGFHVFIV